MIGHGLGTCPAATILGADCDSWWYYLNPISCSANTRAGWAAVCAATPQGSGGNCVADPTTGQCMAPATDWGSIITTLAIVAGVAFVLPSLIKKL